MAAPTGLSFCHLVVGVTDMDRAVEFYRDALGMDVVFETLISADPFDATLQADSQQEGRVVGGVRMSFIKDPDGSPVEFIELPGDARSSYEMHRGVPLQMGAAA
ncbi:VOC family protein [Mycobacterium sp.]|uniref:VOC family protein n=1 Tax=Mycobacterium sp. TaxID=1785 RepID=UPI0031DF66AB